MMPTTLSNPIGIPASGLLLENYWSKIKKTDQKSRGDRASRNQVRLVLLVWLEHGIGNFSLPLSIETSIFKYIGDCPITFGAPLRTGWCVQFVQFEPGFLYSAHKIDGLAEQHRLSKPGTVTWGCTAAEMFCTHAPNIIFDQPEEILVLFNGS